MGAAKAHVALRQATSAFARYFLRFPGTPCSASPSCLSSFEEAGGRPRRHSASHVVSCSYGPHDQGKDSPWPIRGEVCRHRASHPGDLPRRCRASATFSRPRRCRASLLYRASAPESPGWHLNLIRCYAGFLPRRFLSCFLSQRAAASSSISPQATFLRSREDSGSGDLYLETTAPSACPGGKRMILMTTPR